jgi:hypothetical protein
MILAALMEQVVDTLGLDHTGAPFNRLRPRPSAAGFALLLQETCPVIWQVGMLGNFASGWHVIGAELKRTSEVHRPQLRRQAAPSAHRKRLE